MSTSISTTLTACLESFDQLIARVEQPDYRHEGDFPLVSWTDELGRLRVWIRTVGADRTGPSSLEAMLGDTSRMGGQPLKEVVAKVLEGLNRCLTEILEELSEAGPSTSGDDASSDTSSEKTDLQLLHVCVVNDIDCLHVLSPIILQPGPAVLNNTSKGSLVEDDENPGTSSAREPHPHSTNPSEPRADHGQDGIVAVKDEGHDGHSGNGDHGDAHRAGH